MELHLIPSTRKELANLAPDKLRLTDEFNQLVYSMRSVDIPSLSPESRARAFVHFYGLLEPPPRCSESPPNKSFLPIKLASNENRSSGRIQVAIHPA